MSRPTTRSKNKRDRQVDDADTISRILRNIHTTGKVTSDDVNKLYMIWKPVCQGCRVNIKDNPNCFCGLIPASSRKSGLWQKISMIVQAFGSDPSKDLRNSIDAPAGLTNLGATCYANSILQCLYMNKSFREGIFAIEPNVLAQNPVLDQLARLFAQLHASKMAFIDSSPFVKTLELDNGVQQDSHEFLTLLLSLLERCLRQSKVSKARTIVQDLFRGSVSHVTKCSHCGKDSEASSNMEDFYELELNVKGLKSLDESLDDYLNVEELDGDNQYFCQSCKARVNATRSIKLRMLPPVLNFQLKRCIFLPKTTTKKKITSAFSFPRELNMGKRLSETSHVESVYDLSAVLIHKGTAVNSGHYIAHIKDVNTGQWWEFDDEHVSNLGSHPFGEPSSSTSKAVMAEPQALDKGSINSTRNGNCADDNQQQSAECSTSSDDSAFSSTDAYMLMYNLKSSTKDDENRSNICGANDAEVGGNMIPFHDGLSLPAHLYEEIRSQNASYADACLEYESKKEIELGRITERREEVQLVLSESPVNSLDEPFYWICSDWLRSWSDNIIPPLLDNTTIQCLHGKVPASKVAFMKRISVLAWSKIFTKYGGGPPLSNEDYCMDCLIDGARLAVCADTYRDRRTLMKEIAVNALLGKCTDGTYCVSRQWLQQWAKRKILDAPSEADAGPTSSIRCPHGQLLPELAAGAKRVLVPEKLWLFLYEDAIVANRDDSIDFSTFPSDSRQCSQCSDELSEVALIEDSRRVVKLKQRQNHEKLATGKTVPLSLESKYYLVPTTWLSKWRNYINASSKIVSSSVDKPENLEAAINSLKCEKHLRLLERPPDLVYKRGFVQQKSSADALTIIAENDWRCFCEEWEGAEDKCILATIEFSDSAGNNVIEFCREMPLSEQPVSSNDEVNNGIEFKQPVVRTSPEICQDCIGERESCELMEKLNYCNEDICVYFSHGKEAPKSILEAPEATSDPDRRFSKRSRKTNSGDFVNLKVSGSTSIYQLKLMIWESFGVVKENQILRKGNVIIDEECATLADKNIFPGDKLWVMDSEIHEHRDIADELSDQKVTMQHTEEGFRGTLLTANVSSGGD